MGWFGKDKENKKEKDNNKECYICGKAKNLRYTFVLGHYELVCNECARDLKG
jgi:hypothetical protein